MVSAKRRPQKQRPYRRCGVDTEIPYRLPFWREFCWVLQVRVASGVDTEFPYRVRIVDRGVDCRDPVCRHHFRFPERRRAQKPHVAELAWKSQTFFYQTSATNLFAAISSCVSSARLQGHFRFAWGYLAKMRAFLGLEDPFSDIFVYVFHFFTKKRQHLNKMCPHPFQGQSQKVVHIYWVLQGRGKSAITPQKLGHFAKLDPGVNL